MSNNQRNVLLILVIAVVVLSIWSLERKKAGSNGPRQEAVSVVTDSSGMDSEEKAKMFDSAKEITTPDGFINTNEISISEFVGDKVVLIDFWTYSCINCQRTTPYLNAWWDKYKDDGLVIIGIHTPEFDFEKDYDNVLQAVNDFGIEFPVVLDNDYSTWRAYQNRYWPRKYLIDIDGYVVYDHIGEGKYDETEAVIQELLEERRIRLGLDALSFEEGTVQVDAPEKTSATTPEIYFGSKRNEYLANGSKLKQGIQAFALSELNDQPYIYLDGTWDIQPEYAKAVQPDGSILLNFTAKNVFMVASSDQAVLVDVLLDGKPITSGAGKDIVNSQVRIQNDKLYTLVELDEAESHQLRLNTPEAGLEAFTFTFG